MKLDRSISVAFVLVLILGALPGGPAGSAEAAVQSPTFLRYVAPAFPWADSAAEPSLGVDWSDDAVFYQSYADTYRAAFDASNAATWTDVSSPSSVFNIDPIASVDHVTGRVFAGGLDGACSVLSYTDNDGGSWTPMANSCAGAAVDHPTIGSGAWAGGQPLNAIYSRAVYYCAQTSIAQCSVSYDGGLTFRPGVAVQCGFINPGLHGSVHVGSNGWTYLPFQTCGSVNGVAVSKDNGLTWTGRPITGATAPSLAFDPDVATTTSGWAYVAYPTSGYGAGVALTKDGGATWTNFGDVASAAGIRSSTFHEMVAGDDGRAAVAYLGSTTDGNPHASSFGGVWYVYVSYTFNGGQTWATVRASDDVAQRGWICAEGTGCGEGRNLLDFIDAQIDSKGRVVIGYADGCTGTCESGSGAGGANYANIIRQSGGSTMFAAYDPSGPSAPSAPTLSGTAGNSQASLTWTTPADGGSAITGYKVYRNGALRATLGATNGYTDTGLTNGQSYTYEVSAVNAVGESGKSNAVGITPFAVTPPTAPQGLAAQHSAGPNSGKIKLTWSAPASNGGAAVTSYKVYRSTASGLETHLTTVGNVLTWTDTGLTRDVTYFYKVSALNSAGEGSLSNEASALG